MLKEQLASTSGTRFAKLRGPVTVGADHLPAGLGSAEDIGRAEATAAAADHVEVDDGIFSIVGKPRQRKAEDEMARGVVAVRWVEIQDGVGLASCDTNGFCQRILFPEIGRAGTVDFFGELVEDADRYRFEEMMIYPFVKVVLYKAAGIGAGDKEVVGL